MFYEVLMLFIMYLINENSFHIKIFRSDFFAVIQRKKWTYYLFFAILQRVYWPGPLGIRLSCIRPLDLNEFDTPALDVWNQPDKSCAACMLSKDCCHHTGRLANRIYSHSIYVFVPVGLCNQSDKLHIYSNLFMTLSLGLDYGSH